MSEDAAGYTLAEALAALLMVGLAVAGLTQATALVGRFMSAAGETAGAERASALAQRDLDKLMESAGPFGAESGRFDGAAERFDFDCGGAASCGAALALIDGRQRLIVTREGRAVSTHVLAAGGHRFEYLTDRGVSNAWASGSGGVLRAVALVGAKGAAVAVAPVWGEQPADCRFDAVAGDCRSEGS